MIRVTLDEVSDHVSYTCFRFQKNNLFQIRMNVSTKTAAVFTTVLIPKAVMLVPVRKGLNWHWTAKTVLVSIQQLRYVKLT